MESPAESFVGDFYFVGVQTPNNPIMAQSPDPFVNLFQAYVGKVGVDLIRSSMIMGGKQQSTLYVNGFNFVYWAPGAKQPATYQAFANGVTQLAGVSHLGPALASLVQVYQDSLINPAISANTWKSDISALLSGVIASEQANNEAYWSAIDPIVFGSYAKEMTKMIAYGLSLVKKYLEDALKNPSILTFSKLRSRVLNSKDPHVPFDYVMIGTFALANIAVQYHSIMWLQDQRIDWANASVLLSGQFGRATGGMSKCTNTAVKRLLVASNGTLDDKRILIASAGPAVDPTQTDPSYWSGMQRKVQSIWYLTRSSSALADPMFKGYHSIRQEPCQILPTDEGGKPPMEAFLKRLKFALAHPDQELASCTANFMVEKLGKNKFNPAGLWIPGMTDVKYPKV